MIVTNLENPYFKTQSLRTVWLPRKSDEKRKKWETCGVPTWDWEGFEAEALGCPQSHLGCIDITTSVWILRLISHKQKHKHIKRNPKQRELKTYPEYRGMEQGSWASASQALVLIECFRNPSLQTRVSSLSPSSTLTVPPSYPPPQQQPISSINLQIFNKHIKSTNSNL